MLLQEPWFRELSSAGVIPKGQTGFRKTEPPLSVQKASRAVHRCPNIRRAIELQLQSCRVAGLERVSISEEKDSETVATSMRSLLRKRSVIREIKKAT